jgi:hypothetical protein
VVESFGGKLDTGNKISTRGQVLGSKFDDLQERNEKMTFRMRVVRPEVH